MYVLRVDGQVTNRAISKAAQFPMLSCGLEFRMLGFRHARLQTLECRFDRVLSGLKGLTCRLYDM